MLCACAGEVNALFRLQVTRSILSSVKDYLERIGADKADLKPNLESLRFLQRGHLLAVPFENLDIHWKRPIVLDLEKFRTKIVTERRGGFCYELNGLFNELLRSIGFKTKLISARVYNGTDHGPEFDHAAIIVDIDDNAYLADVGFGAFAAEPLRMALGEIQNDPNGAFVVRRYNEEYIEIAKREKAAWRSEYIFQKVERALSEFEEMCDFQQYSPDSHFTKGKLCSLMTSTGRKTLTDKSFIVTSRGVKHESPVLSETQFYSLLSSEFGIRATAV
jgi:N-hydroxyarylamine O-acetyltransferase